MFVNSACGKYDETLINDTKELDNGSSIQILKMLKWSRKDKIFVMLRSKYIKLFINLY